MNERRHSRTVLVLVLFVAMLAPVAQLDRGAGAQEATPSGPNMGTPVGAQPATPVPGQRSELMPSGVPYDSVRFTTPARRASSTAG